MILININLPKNCNSCSMHNECGLCLANNETSCDYDKYADRPDDCPIVMDVDEWLSSFNTDSAPICFNKIQELKRECERDERATKS